jgi:hypothetical protein
MKLWLGGESEGPIMNFQKFNWIIEEAIAAHRQVS